MSDSQTIDSLLQKNNAQLLRAQKEHEAVEYLLNRLPRHVPAPAHVSPFGYCAQGHLRFTQGPSLAEMLEAYPPLSLVMVSGATQTFKPVNALRPEERHDNIEEAYPVVHRHEARGGAKSGGADTLRWWTALGERDVEVSFECDPTCLGETVDIRAFEPFSQTYSTGSTSGYLPRIHVPPVVTSRAHRSRMRDDMPASLGLGQNFLRTRLVTAILARVDAFPDVPFTHESLPARDPSGAMPTRHWLAGAGNFWKAFEAVSEDDIRKLVEAVERYRQSRPQRDADAEAYFKTAHAALARFFATRGGWHPTAGPTERYLERKLNRHIAQLCGFPVLVSPRRSIRMGDTLTLVVQVPHSDEERQLTVACLPDKRLLLQDIPA